MPDARDTPLAQLLDTLAAEGDLYDTEPDGRLRCFACGRRCEIRRARFQRHHGPESSS